MDIYSALRPLLFCLDPEAAHSLALKALNRPWLAALLAGGRHGSGTGADAPVTINGLVFRNALGLAAGADKNALALAGWERLGFGFVEVGTVTPLPQAGNPRPRVWRFPARRALVNAMGFPNDGAAAVAARLAAWRRTHPLGRGMLIGVNCGKQKSTALEHAAQDYIAVMRATWDLADFFVINISSPNTPGLRDLQEARHITALVGDVVAERDSTAAAASAPDTRRPPVWVKIAPDMDDAALAATARAIAEAGADAIVATNTTTDHSALGDDARRGNIRGGLSGAPLLEKSLHAVEVIRGVMPTGFPIIGCGGISCGHCARKFRAAGADLVEIYTALVYSGPRAARDIIEALK